VINRQMIRAVRDVVLVIAIAWFGTSVLARDVLGWHHQARDAAITLLDLLVSPLLPCLGLGVRPGDAARAQAQSLGLGLVLRRAHFESQY
jgi:hypothetical protein